MTKKTKKENKQISLKWRMSKLPTVDELQILIANAIITQEEARQVLFSEESIEDRGNKSLKEEIKFLRELVEKLSKNSRDTIIKYIEIDRPILYKEKDWYGPYATWSNPIYTYGNATGSTGGTGLTATNIATNFSDIKTF